MTGTFDEALRVLRTVTYPGAELFIKEVSGSEVEHYLKFVWVLNTVDSDAAFEGWEPGPMRVGTSCAISAHVAQFDIKEQRQFVMDSCWQALQDALLHEAGEWFVADGGRPFNPHRRDRDETAD